MGPTNNYLIIKSNKNNSNNNYFIEKWCGVPLRLRVLNETLGLKRPLIFFSALWVPIRYQVLNGKDPINVDGLRGAQESST